jgi:hypothetical protein
VIVGYEVKLWSLQIRAGFWTCTIRLIDHTSKSKTNEIDARGNFQSGQTRPRLFITNFLPSSGASAPHMHTNYGHYPLVVVSKVFTFEISQSKRFPTGTFFIGKPPCQNVQPNVITVPPDIHSTRLLLPVKAERPCKTLWLSTYDRRAGCHLDPELGVGDSEIASYLPEPKRSAERSSLYTERMGGIAYQGRMRPGSCQLIVIVPPHLSEFPIRAIIVHQNGIACHWGRSVEWIGVTCGVGWDWDCSREVVRKSRPNTSTSVH